MLEYGFSSPGSRKPLQILNRKVTNTKQWSKIVSLKLYCAFK